MDHLIASPSIDQVSAAWSPWEIMDQMSTDVLQKIGMCTSEPTFALPPSGSVPDFIRTLKEQMRVFFLRHQERAANVLGRLLAGDGLAELIEDERWAIHQMMRGIAEFAGLHRPDGFWGPEACAFSSMPSNAPQRAFQWLVKEWWPRCGQEWQIEKLAKDKILGLTLLSDLPA